MSTVTSTFHDFMLSCRADGLKKSTISWYRSILGRFVASQPNTLIKDISTNDLREYILALRASAYTEYTIDDHIRVLHKFFSWCSAEYAIPNRMHGRIKYPNKSEPKPRVARLEDVQAMFQVAGESNAGVSNWAILVFMLDTGCRAGGLCALHVSDLDIAGRRAFVTEKGNKTRAVIFTALTAKLLRDWIRVRQPVSTLFYNLNTLEPLTVSGLYQLFRRLGRRALVNGHYHPHSLRHLFATAYLSGGGDIATLSRLMGHRDVSTTLNHYIAFTDHEIREKHEKYSPVSRLNPEKPILLRDGELFLICEHLSPEQHKSPPQLVYVTWQQQSAYDFISTEMDGCQWEMLHCPNGYGQQPTYIIDRSWYG